ncbi:MAG: Fic family protein, partial [Patescibacteria group bacterium]
RFLQQFTVINLSSIENYQSTNQFGYKNNSQIGAIFSSNIEGNSIDINTFFNFNSSFKKKKEKQEIDDLANSYEFAKKSEFNLTNFLKAHKIITKNSLEPFQQGKLKSIPNGLFGTNGLIYLACSVEKTKSELNQLFDEISKLNQLSIPEAFFYSSYLHMRIAHIHPFTDGNGRIARLAEKWFLSKFIGPKAYFIPSEEYYFNNRSQYYSNLKLGDNYEELDYTKSFEFLRMLVDSLGKSN